MRKSLFLIFLSLLIMAFIPPQLGRHGNDTSNTFTLKSFGSTCDGINDDAPALAAAGAQFRTIQASTPTPVTLTISGNCTLKTCPVASDGKTAFFNVTNITIIATGATITMTAGACTSFTGSIVNPWTADFFKPNQIGDVCVTMKTPGAEANYPIGRWVIVSGQGVQVNSFPPNYATFEYKFVTSNSGGQVCFSEPLQNFYPDDARAGIDLTGQNCSNNYCGGPGALSLMGPSWGGYFRTVGGTWHSDAVSNTFWPSRLVIFDNVNWPAADPLGSNQCWFPTFSGTVIFNNSTFTNCNVEVDKEIDQIIVNNSTFRTLQFQSPSYHSIVVNNCGSIGSPCFGFNGTPPSTTCNNSTVAIAFGNTFGSAPQKFIGTNCNFHITNSAANEFTLDHVTYTYASGTFSILNQNICGGFPQWFSNGGRMAALLLAGGATDADNYFTITGTSVPITPATGVNCTQTISVTTTLANASDPPPAFVSGGTFVWLADQARDMSCSGCASDTPSTDRTASDLNFSAAQHQPIYTYFNRTYTCPNNLANVPGSFDLTGDPHNGNILDSASLRGTWISYSVNVITADTNPSDTTPVLTFGAGQLFNPTTGATGFSSSTSEVINLNIAGTRTILPGSTSGSQAGDTLATPQFGNNTWVAGASGTLKSSGFTNGPAAQCPVVQIIGQTSR